MELRGHLSTGFYLKTLDFFFQYTNLYSNAFASLFTEIGSNNQTGGIYQIHMDLHCQVKLIDVFLQEVQNV